MKIVDVQRNLSLHGAMTAKRAEAIGTQLRGAGLLPKGGRGPHAPDANETEIAHYILAMAGADRVADAVDTAHTLAGIVDKQGSTLLSVLAQAVASPSDAYAIRHIRVVSHIPMAEVTYRREGCPDTCERFFSPGLWGSGQMVPEAQGQGFIGRIGHIGGAALSQMAIDFAQPDTDESGEWIAN